MFDRTVGKYCSKPYYLDEDEAHKKALEKFVEDYGNFIENTVRTPAGCPILLTIEDACPHADLVDDGPLSIDCGSCSYFRQPAESVLGVCHNEKMRCVSVKQGNTGASKEET